MEMQKQQNWAQEFHAQRAMEQQAMAQEFQAQQMQQANWAQQFAEMQQKENWANQFAAQQAQQAQQAGKLCFTSIAVMTACVFARAKTFHSLRREGGTGEWSWETPGREMETLTQRCWSKRRFIQ